MSSHLRATAASIVSGLLLAAQASSPGFAQSDYPSKPIIWVVTVTPGGTTDSGARMLAKAVSARIGQPMIVENRPGAGGVVGTEHVVRSKPDGYTILFGSTGLILTNPALYKNLTFDPLKDLVGVRGLTESPLVFVANPDKPYKTLSELISFAKQNPGKINYASAGAGTTTHLVAELFQNVAGITLQHIPYKGSIPALTDVMAGAVDVMFDYPVTSMPQIGAGKLRALAVISDGRLKIMPEVPSVVELGLPGAQMKGWSGVFVPAGTPRNAIAKLEQAFGDALQDQEVVKYLSDNGQRILTDLTFATFPQFLSTENERIRDVVKRTGASAY